MKGIKILRVYFDKKNVYQFHDFFISVDDCGGGYSESIAEMCDELQATSGGLLGNFKMI